MIRVLSRKARPLSDKYSHLSELPGTEKACALAEILIDAYIRDVVKVVEEGVSNTAARQISGRDPRLSDWGHQRLKSLKSWKRQPSPLSSDPNTLSLLLDAVVDDPRNLPTGLPMSIKDPLNHRRFAGMLSLYRKAPEGRAIKPPLSVEGSLRFIIPIALRYITSLCSEEGEQAEENFAELVIAAVAYSRGLVWIPWCRKSLQGDRGSQKLVYNQWRQISSSRQSVLRLTQNLEVPLSPSKRTARQALLDDVNGEWTADSLLIADIHTILHKQTLPADWVVKNIKFQEKEAWVKEVYEWVERNADLSHPVHQLALILGLIFGKLHPLTYYPKGLHVVIQKDAKLNVTKTIRDAEWTKRSSSRLRTTTSSVMVMIATAIIAYTEERSPLRVRLSQNKPLGEWSPFHST
jgi:hypothetical protein